MTADLRPISADELPAFARAMSFVFATPAPSPERVEQMATTTELDRTLAGIDGQRVVVTSATTTFRLSVPGGVLPAGGLWGVTVSPTHRRMGMLTALIRHHLDDGARRGEPLACLWASEAGIYGRFGYGLATRALRWEMHRSHGSFLPGLGERGRLAASRVRLLDPGTASDEIVSVVRPVHDALLGVVPGVVERPDAMWAGRTRNPSGDTRWAVLGHGPQVEAYAAYRVTGGWGDFGPENSMLITELVATTTDGYLGMFRFLLDHDLVGPVTAALRPADELLPLILADQRQLARTSIEGMWVRLIDVPAALSGRRYAGSHHLVLDVADPFSPSNSGRWALDAGPDGAACQRSREPSDLSLSVGALAAAYLGGTPFTDLVRAGRASEDRPGAALAASRLFASDPLPWAPTFF